MLETSECSVNRIKIHSKKLDTYIECAILKFDFKMLVTLKSYSHLYALTLNDLFRYAMEIVFMLQSNIPPTKSLMLNIKLIYKIIFSCLTPRKSINFLLLLANCITCSNQTTTFPFLNNSFDCWKPKKKKFLVFVFHNLICCRRHVCIGTVYICVNELINNKPKYQHKKEQKITLNSIQVYATKLSIRTFWINSCFSCFFLFALLCYLSQVHTHVSLEHRRFWRFFYCSSFTFFLFCNNLKFMCHRKEEIHQFFIRQLWIDVNWIKSSNSIHGFPYFYTRMRWRKVENKINRNECNEREMKLSQTKNNHWKENPCR